MASDEAKDYIKSITERFAAMTQEEKDVFLGLYKYSEYREITLNEVLDKLADELGKDCPDMNCKCKQEKEE